MIHTGTSTGSLVRFSSRTFTFKLRLRPGTYRAHASRSRFSKPCRANGRAYFRCTRNCSTIALSRSTSSDFRAWARSNGQIAAVSCGVSALLAPINTPE